MIKGCGVLSKKGVSTLKVAAAYVGTVVGAGFATGQEIFQFFTRFGAMGLVGLMVTTLMFMVFGYIIMSLGRRFKARSHLEIVMHYGGSVTGTIIDSIITFFLFGSFTTMISGTGALFAQQFDLPSLWGNVLMAVITAVTVLTGINGVINSISFVVPFMLAAVIGTSIFSIMGNPPDITSAIVDIGEKSLISNWFLAAILYVSYNTIISISILAPLGSEAQNKRAIRNGAVLGGFILGLGSYMIYLTLACSIEEIKGLEVPMIYMAGKISPTMHIAYAIVLIAEIYTTAVGSLFGFVSRITDIQENPAKSRMVVAVSTAAALCASQFGFSNFVRYFYPLIGYGGIFLLVYLTYTVTIKHR